MLDNVVPIFFSKYIIGEPVLFVIYLSPKSKSVGFFSVTSTLPPSEYWFDGSYILVVNPFVA